MPTLLRTFASFPLLLQHALIYSRSYRHLVQEDRRQSNKQYTLKQFVILSIRGNIELLLRIRLQNVQSVLFPYRKVVMLMNKMPRFIITMQFL